MGLLSAGIFQGLGAGVSAFGGQMMRGVEKEQDEAMLQQRVRVLAEIQRENAKLNRQDALDFETDPNNLTRRTAAARTTTLAAADTAREVETASLADPKLNEARRAKAADDAKAAKKVANDQTIEDAANPELLAAKGKIALADPEVAARIAASRASAASSGAHAGLLAVQTAGARLAVEDQKRLGKLYDDANAALTDPNLTDDERGKKVTSLMTQATLIKSKNAPAAGKNPELDTVKVEETMDDGSGKVVKTTRTEVRRPGAGGGGAENYEAPTEATIRKMAANLDNPQAVAEFKKRFGADAFAQVSAPKSGKPASASPAAAQAAPPVDSRPAPDAITQAVAADLAPVVEQYKAAQAQLAAASKSGDAASLARYSQAVQALRDNIARQANERLGNGAQRYLSSVGL